MTTLVKLKSTSVLVLEHSCKSSMNLFRLFSCIGFLQQGASEWTKDWKCDTVDQRSDIKSKVTKVANWRIELSIIIF